MHLHPKRHETSWRKKPKVNFSGFEVTYIRQMNITLVTTVLVMRATIANVPYDMCFDVPKSAYVSTGQKETYRPAIAGIPAKIP